MSLQQKTPPVCFLPDQLPEAFSFIDTFVETAIVVFLYHFFNRFLKKPTVPVPFKIVLRSSISWLTENTTGGLLLERSFTYGNVSTRISS